MTKMDEIWKKIEEGHATEDELKRADDFLCGMEADLSSKIDEWERAEVAATHHQRTIWLKRAVAAAASLLLIVSVSLWYYHDEDFVAVETQKDTYDDPNEAAAETERALLKFSESINKAISYNP